MLIMNLITRKFNCIKWAKIYQDYTYSPHSVWLIHFQPFASFNKIEFFQRNTQGKYTHNCQIVLAPSRKISFSLIDLKNSFSKFLTKHVFKKRALKTLKGYLWYSTLNELQCKEFMNLLNMPDNYASWFKITELHVWMLLVRLQQDGPDELIVRTAVMEAMWDDATKRAKSLAPYNRSFRKNFKELYHGFVTKLFIYDEALLMNDQVLSNALWYYFFDRQCDDPRKLELLVSYIRNQIFSLNSIHTKDVKEKDISPQIWISFSHFSKNFQK